VFRYTGSAWEEEAKLTAFDGVAYDYFGFAVSVNGHLAAVGANFDDDHGQNSGSVHVFRYTGSAWKHVAKLTADDGAEQDRLGRAVSVYGSMIVVSAHFDDDSGTDSGSAHVFLVSDDCNTDGVLDECELAFGTSPDCNHNRIPDECDIANSAGTDCNLNDIPDECDFIGAGDFDADGDVDSKDFDGFADCLAGPAVLPAPPVYMCIAACLDAFDDDGDGDVDLRDFNGFQVLFTGPTP